MKKKKESPPFFMSWSGAPSRELAYTLRLLLCKVFRIPEVDIFISDSDLSGNKPWLDMIRQKASDSKIEIICITQENCNKPWIHYELGICSYLEGKKCKTIVPVYFDLSSKDVPANLNMITQSEAVCVESTLENPVGEIGYYSELSKRFIFQIDRFLCCHMNGIYRQYDFNNNQDEEIESMFKNKIAIASSEMEQIFKKYDGHDIFISRPMQGIDPKINQELFDILYKLKNDLNDKKIKVYFADKNCEHVSIPLSRIGIIRTSRSFILIYPKIQDVSSEKNAPSSCFIELGAAMALNINIKIYAQRDAKLPAFVYDKYERFVIHYFENIDDVYNLILEHTKKEFGL